MQGDELDQFVRDIVADKNLPSIENDEIRNQLVDDLKEELLGQVDRAIVHAIPEDRLDGFNELLDNSEVSDEALQEYVAASGVDVQQVATDTMRQFRELYLTEAGARED